MSSLDLEFDLDARVNKLELEWRQAFEAGLLAQADYHSLAVADDAELDALERAREQLERSEQLKTQIHTKIDSLERRILNRR